MIPKRLVITILLALLALSLTGGLAGLIVEGKSLQA